MMPTLQEEAFSAELFEQLRPLAQRCWDEETEAKASSCAFETARDFPIEPDMEAYQLHAERGALVLLTLRAGGQLVGYAVGLTYRSPHHKALIAAFGDSIYIEPAFRSYFPVLAERLERGLAERGAVIIGWPVTQDSPLFHALVSRGYRGDDIVMEKKLCV